MQTILDHLGGFIIAGTVMLLIVNLNVMMNDASQEIFRSSYSQSAALSSALIVENDIYRAGYRISGDKITLADSLNFRFNADINNDSIPDIVYYYLGTATGLDKPLFRRVNTETAVQVAAYSTFSFAYYDSLANALSAATLSTQTGRNRIRSIELLSTTRWPSANAEGRYQSTVWRKTITPRNL